MSNRVSAEEPDHERAAPPPDARPLRPLVLSASLLAGGLAVLAVVAALVSDEPWTSGLVIPFGFAAGWTGASLFEWQYGSWGRPIQSAHARPSAELEPTARTVSIAVAGALLLLGVVIGVGAVLPGREINVVPNTLAVLAGLQWFGARQYLRRERKTGDRLLTEVRWRDRRRRSPLVAVPADAVKPAERASSRSTAGG